MNAQLHPIFAQLVPMLSGIASRGLTPAGHFLQALAEGYTPSDQELIDLAHALHAAIADKPLMQYMDKSFEDMADIVSRASERLQRDEAQTSSDFYSMRRELRERAA